MFLVYDGMYKTSGIIIHYVWIKTTSYKQDVDVYPTLDREVFLASFELPCYQ